MLLTEFLIARRRRYGLTGRKTSRIVCLLVAVQLGVILS